MVETVPTKKPQITTYVEPYVHIAAKWLAEQDDRTLSKFVERLVKRAIDEAIEQDELPDEVMSEVDEAKKAD